LVAFELHNITYAGKGNFCDFQHGALQTDSGSEYAALLLA
jgi:hypothetical protein